MNQQGLTLVELLVVLLIVGIGWFSLLPRLDVWENNNSPLSELNSMISKAAHESMKSGLRQDIFFVSGQNYVKWGEQVQELPGYLSRVEVNDQPATGSRWSFSIYPAGHMDQLVMIMTDGVRLESQPLAPSIRVMP